MKKSEVLSHYDEVQRTDFEFIDAIRLGQDEGPTLSEESHFYAKLLTGSASEVSFTAPRPLLAMLRSAFGYFPGDPSEVEPHIASLIGTKLLPGLGFTDDTSSTPGKFISVNASDCSDAEPRFLDVVEQTQFGTSMNQKRVSAYHDSDGTLIALRKSYDVSTALTLQPISHNGITLPPGTIIGMDQLNVKIVADAYANDCYYTVYEITNTLNVRPFRLSPWAFEEPLDRAIFGVDYVNEGSIYYGRRRANLVEGTTIHDFRAAAKAVMLICEVE